MRRKINIALVLFALLVGLPFYWLLMDNRPGDVSAKAVRIEQLRSLARSMPGPVPVAAEYELVAFRLVPRDLFAAGSGLKRAVIGVTAWRLPVPGGAPIMIDTGITPADAAEMGVSSSYPEAQGRVDRALETAGTILLTHEHPDHLGGMARRPADAVDPVTRLNEPQRAALAAMRPTAIVADPRFARGQPYAVAPGVVVIPAPSHTPGSQLIFVTLANGRELLFAGDIATMTSSWQERRARSRLVGDHLAPEDRREVYAWLRTIRALRASAPELIVIPGHDSDWLLHDPATKAAVHAGFTAQPTGAPLRVGVERAPRQEAGSR